MICSFLLDMNQNHNLYLPFIATSMPAEQLIAGVKEFCTEGITLGNGDSVYKFRNSNLGIIQMGDFYDCELSLASSKEFDKHWGELPGFQSYFRIRNIDPLGSKTLEAACYISRGVYDWGEKFGFFLETEKVGLKGLVVAADPNTSILVFQRGFNDTRELLIDYLKYPSSESLNKTVDSQIYMLSLMYQGSDNN
jgi:hypothetical protein